MFFISKQNYNFRKQLIWKFAHCRVFYFLPITTENKYDQKNTGRKRKQHLKKRRIFICHNQKELKSPAVKEQGNLVALTVCLMVTICKHKHVISFSFMLYLLRGAPLQSSSILPSESLSEIRNYHSESILNQSSERLS